MFNTFNDPAKFGLFYAAALMFRRGDVKPAQESVEILLHDQDMQLNMHDKLTYIPAAYGVSEKHRLGIKMPVEEGTKGDHVIEKETVLVPESDGEVRSDTGEMYRSWASGYGWIDTDRTKAVYGLISKQGRMELDGVAVTCENEFATIVLSSLSDDKISESKNILVTAVGRAENTGTEFNEEGNVMLKFGTAPILTERIDARIELKTKHSNLKVWSVNAEGFLIGHVPFKYEDGVLTLELGKTWPSIYYLIQAE